MDTFTRSAMMMLLGMLLCVMPISLFITYCSLHTCPAIGVTYTMEYCPPGSPPYPYDPASTTQTTQPGTTTTSSTSSPSSAASVSIGKVSPSYCVCLYSLTLPKDLVILLVLTIAILM